MQLCLSFEGSALPALHMHAHGLAAISNELLHSTILLSKQKSTPVLDWSLWVDAASADDAPCQRRPLSAGAAVDAGAATTINKLLCTEECQAQLDSLETHETKSGLRYKDIVVGKGPSPPIGYQARRRPVIPASCWRRQLHAMAPVAPAAVPGRVLAVQAEPAGDEMARAGNRLWGLLGTASILSPCMGRARA